MVRRLRRRMLEGFRHPRVTLRSPAVKHGSPPSATHVGAVSFTPSATFCSPTFPDRRTMFARRGLPPDFQPLANTAFASRKHGICKAQTRHLQVVKTAFASRKHVIRRRRACLLAVRHCYSPLGRRGYKMVSSKTRCRRRQTMLPPLQTVRRQPSPKAANYA